MITFVNETYNYTVYKHLPFTIDDTLETKHMMCSTIEIIRNVAHDLFHCWYSKLKHALFKYRIHSKLTSWFVTLYVYIIRNWAHDMSHYCIHLELVWWRVSLLISFETKHERTFRLRKFKTKHLICSNIEFIWMQDHVTLDYWDKSQLRTKKCYIAMSNC